MTTTSIQEKPQYMFRLFDTDGDGTITVADFQQRADRIVGQFPQADPQQVQAVRQQYMRLWEELADAADSDGDGQVSEKEFAALLLSSNPREAAATVGNRMAEFDLADVNADGYLDRQELTPLLKGYGVEADRVDTVMAILDRDGDGRISADEYGTLLRDVFLSTDPKAPGVAIFAKLNDA